jgi:hypothetical protein
MNETIKHIAPWLAGAAVIGALSLAPVASAAPGSSSVSKAQVGDPGASSPQPLSTPFETGPDPLVPADVGADPQVPYVPLSSSPLLRRLVQTQSHEVSSGIPM